MDRRGKSGTTDGSTGSHFALYLTPVLEALVDRGRSATPSEVREYIKERHPELAGPDQRVIQKRGETKFSKDVHFARLYLAISELISGAEHGVWRLTKAGLDAASSLPLPDGVVAEIVKRGHAQCRKGRGSPPAAPTEPRETGPEEATGDEPEPPLRNHRDELMALLRGLTGPGFERVCADLMREAGFEDVKLTRASGDHGIDGEGRLVVNQFVSFQVAFQCKQKNGSVSADMVRDFRGAMGGRAEKGIIFTTGDFTQPANKEATRDGVPQIELVDGDKLLNTFEKLRLGLISVDKVDQAFFEPFK